MVAALPRLSCTAPALPSASAPPATVSHRELPAGWETSCDVRGTTRATSGRGWGSGDTVAQMRDGRRRDHGCRRDACASEGGWYRGR